VALVLELVDLTDLLERSLIEHIVQTSTFHLVPALVTTLLAHHSYLHTLTQLRQETGEQPAALHKTHQTMELTHQVVITVVVLETVEGTLTQRVYLQVQTGLQP
jgi:hypothetical protein